MATSSRNIGAAFLIANMLTSGINFATGMVGACSSAGHPAAVDSPLGAPRRIQTGQKSLSPAAENFVPQTGQVRASCCTDPGSLPGSSRDPPDSAFTASAVLQRRFAHRSPSQSWRPGPPHLQLSCRSLIGNHFERNSKGTAKIFHYFRQPIHSIPKSIARAWQGGVEALPGCRQEPVQCSI